MVSEVASVRRLLTALLITWLLLPLAALHAGAQALPFDDPASPCCRVSNTSTCGVYPDPVPGLANANDVAEFLCEHSSFANWSATGSQARTDIINGGSSSGFDTVLPASYATSRYSEAQVEKVLDWARGENPNNPLVQQILLEAAFRKASAHAMFADDSLVRGLYSSFAVDDLAVADPVGEAIALLDSRLCGAPGDETDVTGLGQPCVSQRDCTAGGRSAVWRAWSHYRRVRSPWRRLHERRRLQRGAVVRDA